jgi:hypothetical protein
MTFLKPWKRALNISTLDIYAPIAQWFGMGKKCEASSKILLLKNLYPDGL